MLVKYSKTTLRSNSLKFTPANDESVKLLEYANVPACWFAELWHGELDPEVPTPEVPSAVKNSHMLAFLVSVLA